MKDTVQKCPYRDRNNRKGHPHFFYLSMYLPLSRGTLVSLSLSFSVLLSIGPSTHQVRNSIIFVSKSEMLYHWVISLVFRRRVGRKRGQNWCRAHSCQPVLIPPCIVFSSGVGCIESIAISYEYITYLYYLVCW